MIELPWPAKILWPNGRGHHMAKHRAFKAHKQWAWAATRAAMRTTGIAAYEQLDPSKTPEPRIRWSATFYPKPNTSRAIDEDNAAASLKAYQDGIAQALGVDDSRFAQPMIRFAEKVRDGRVVIVIGEAQ